MITQLTSLLLLLSLAGGAALAAEPTPSTTPAADPLEPLVREALVHNLALESSRLDAHRASAEYAAALTQWLPSVRLETRASHLHDVPDVGRLINPAYAALNQLTGANAFPTDVSFTLPQAYESHVRVTQPLLEEPLRANVSRARAARDAAHESFGAEARRLAASVETQYLQVASLRRVADIDEAALALVQENERVAERLLDAGRATPEAVLRARADRAEVTQQLADAREQAAAATRELNRTLGRPLEGAVELLPDSVFEGSLAGSVDDALRSALARREELAQVDAGVRQAEAGVRIATGVFLPSIAAAFDVGWQGDSWRPAPADRAWTASVVASWDLFHGGSDVAQRSAARAAAERARTLRRDLAERITVEVRNAYESAQVAREAVATAVTRADAARSTYVLVQRRFEEGAASPLELTDARTARTTAETNAVLTLYRYALTRVDLERAAAFRDLPLEKGSPR